MSKSKKRPNTKKTVTTKRTNTKVKGNFFERHLWQILAIVAIIAVAVICIFTMTANAEVPTPDTEVNFEERLFNTAKEFSEAPDFYLDPAYTLKQVTVDNSREYYDLTAYLVKINNFEYDQLFEGGTFVGEASRYSGVYDETEFDEFSEHQLKMIESARSHVIEYIKDSNVLRDKESLIEAIKNVPFYLYTDTSNEELWEVSGSPAVHIGSAIFCYKEYDKFFSVYMFTHELFHHLRYLTCGADFSDMYYIGTPYDEGITDFLALSTGLECPTFKGYVTGYERFHNVIGEYLDIFGEKALEGFFYGTKEFMSSFYTNFEAEHHAFVCAIGYYEMDSTPKMVCRTILKYWREHAA